MNLLFIWTLETYIYVFWRALAWISWLNCNNFAEKCLGELHELLIIILNFKLDLDSRDIPAFVPEELKLVWKLESFLKVDEKDRGHFRLVRWENTEFFEVRVMEGAS